MTVSPKVFWRVVLIVSAASWSSFALACPLNCQNGATCVATGGRLGQRWTCECPLGFTGRLCEQALPEKQARRLVETVTCPGGLTCENGGECAEGHEDWVGTNSKAVCDCSEATELVPQGDGTFRVRKYVGVHCELPTDDYCAECLANDTTFVPNAHDFCVNNAPCRCGEDNFRAFPCDCPAGFSGRHCEFQVTEVSDCTLACSGQGTCVNGVKVNQDTAEPSDVLNLVNGGTENFMHCVCNEGFAGTNCEYDYIECAGAHSGKFCFHGSQCTSNGECECLIDDPVKGKVLAAGDRCEYKATDTCDVERVPSQPANPAGSMSDTAEPFCVNNGVCVKDPNPNSPAPWSCECPSEYVGVRCELKAEDQPTTTTEATTTVAPINPGVDVCQNPAAPTLPLNPKGGMEGTQADPAVCFNHGVCVQESNTGLYYCQCDDGIHTGRQCSEKINEQSQPTASPFSGPSPSQQERIDFCDNPSEPTQPLNSDGGMSFEDDPTCYNYAKCVQDINSDLYYCECNDNTHEGKKCDKLKSTTDSGNINTNTEDNSGGSELEGAAIFGICLLVFAIGFTSAMCYCHYQMRKNRILRRMGDGDAVGFNLNDPRDDEVIEWSAEHIGTSATSPPSVTSTNLAESTAPAERPKGKSKKVFGNDGSGYRHGASARSKPRSQRTAPPQEEEQSFYNVTLG